MVQNVIITFVDDSGIIKNTTKDNSTNTYITDGENITYDTLTLPNNINFSVEHEIVVKGNLVISKGSTMIVKEKIIVEGTLVIEALGKLETLDSKNFQDLVIFKNLIVDGTLETKGLFTTNLDSLITVTGSLKINGTFGSIQNGSFTLKTGGTLEITPDENISNGNPFEDNRNATFTIEDNTTYTVKTTFTIENGSQTYDLNENPLIRREGGNEYKFFYYKEGNFWNYVPIGKMDLSSSTLSATTKMTEDPEGKINTFVGANMRNINLNNSNLRHCDFSNADLSFADLRNCNIQNARLVGTNLKGADLRGANLRDADLREADLTNAIIDDDTNFGNVNWSKTITGPLDIKITNMQDYVSEKLFNYPPGSDINTQPQYDILSNYIIGPNVNASGINLQDVVLNETVMPGQGDKDIFFQRRRITNLNGIILNDANLTNVKLLGVSHINISYEGASLKNANLTGANLKNLDMTTIDITGANMTDATLEGTNISGHDLTNIILIGDLKGLKSGNNIGTPKLSSKHALINGYIVGENVDLTDADLKTADLTDISLKGATLKNVDMSEATLTNLTSGNIANAEGIKLPEKYSFYKLQNFAYGGSIVGPYLNLESTQFIGGKIDAGTVLEGSNLSNAIFKSVEVSSVDFEKTIVKDVSFEDVDLAGVDFTNVKLYNVSTKDIYGEPKLPGGYEILEVDNGKQRIFGPFVKLTNDNFRFNNKTQNTMYISHMNLNNSVFDGSDFSGYGIGGSAERNLYGIKKHDNIYFTSIIQSTLVYASFKNTKLHFVDFSYSDLSGADFSGADFEDVKFTGCDLSGADFSNVDPEKFKYITSQYVQGDENTKFPPGYKLENGYIVGPYTLLGNADLRNANLFTIPFKGAYMAYANIQGANIFKCDFREVSNMFQLTTGLHPNNDSNEDVGTANDLQLPIDDDFSPLLPENYGFALGYIFGPNLTLLGEDLAWVENRRGSLIRKKITISSDDSGKNEYNFSTITQRQGKNVTRPAHYNVWNWMKYYNSLEGIEYTNIIEEQEILYNTRRGALKPEWKKVVTDYGITKRVSYENTETGERRISIQDDMLEEIVTDNIFILAGISLENTIFKVDSIYNVVFICNMNYANFKVLGNLAITQSNIIRGSLNTSTIQLQDGYVVYNDFIFGPNMDLRNVKINDGSIVGMDFRGCILDGMILTRMDISRSNIHECDFSKVTLINCKAVYMTGSPKLRDSSKHAVVYDENLKESTVVVGPIIGPNGLPSNVLLKDGHFLGPGFNYSNETFYGERDVPLIFSSVGGRKTDLTGANFDGVQMAFVELGATSLKNTSWKGARCRWINMNFADLENSNLSDIVLRHSNCKGANFTLCNLRGGEFWDSMFDSLSKFRSADLQRSDFSWTTWDNFPDYAPRSATISFSSIIDFPIIPGLPKGTETMHESWQKETKSGTNVANSYWISGEIRCYRTIMDQLLYPGVINWVFNLPGGIERSNIPIIEVDRPSGDTLKIFLYGVNLGADSGVAWSGAAGAAEYVGIYTLMNIAFDRWEPFKPDFGYRFFPPPYQSLIINPLKSIEHFDKINWLPWEEYLLGDISPGLGNKFWFSLVSDQRYTPFAKRAFIEVWGGWEYPNAITVDDLVDDCFHLYKNDHFHIKNRIVVPIPGSDEDRGRPSYYHGSPGWEVFYYSSIYKKRVYTRKPRVPIKIWDPPEIAYDLPTQAKTAAGF